MDEKPAIKCGQVFDKFMYCSTPPSQFAYYRRHGNYEYCLDHAEDFIKCMTAKLVSDPVRKEVLLSNYNVISTIILDYYTITIGVY